MKGRTKLTSASGKERDERMVRMDYNTARETGSVRYGKYFVFYPEDMGYRYVDYNDIVWAYRRLEDVAGKLSRTAAGDEMHSIMLVTKDKKRVGIPVGEKANAVEGLKLLEEKNSFIDIGYTKQKEYQYL